VDVSRDGENWIRTDRISSAGFSTQTLNYQSTDFAKSEGTLYYRLRQVDISGDEKLYNPIAVTCGDNKQLFTTYPNPSGETFTLVVNDENLVGQANLNIRDINGRLVTQSSIEVLSGMNSYEVSDKLPSGIYFIQIENGKSTSTTLRHSVK
jgi:hypothetical protein